MFLTLELWRLIVRSVVCPSKCSMIFISYIHGNLILLLLNLHYHVSISLIHLQHNSTCQGATITIVAAKDDMQLVPGKISGTVSITVNGGLSKDGTDCAGGAGDGFTLGYECHATSNQGASKFTCSNLEKDLVPSGQVPAGVLVVRANLSRTGTLIWTAHGEVPPEDSGAPADGELPQMPITLLPTGNINGTKMEEYGGSCTDDAPASALESLSDEMKAAWCAASARGNGNN